MANNYWRGTTNSNWGTSTNWSLSLVPTASDGNITVFDGTSPNCTTDAGGKVCNAINFSAYTNTITMTNTITVSGNITLGSGMHVSGASSLIMNGAFTAQSNGFAWPNGLTLQGGSSPTWTLSDTWVIGGLLTVTTTNSTIAGVIQAATCSITAGTLTLGGNITITGLTTIASAVVLNGPSYTLSTGGLNHGSTVTGTIFSIILTGGTWTATGSGYLGVPLTFAGNVTLASIVAFGGANNPTMSLTSGSVTVGTGVIHIGASCILNVPTISWYNLIIDSASGTTVTLNGNLVITNTFTLYNSYAVTFSGTGTLTLSQPITFQSISGSSFTCPISGTSCTFPDYNITLGTSTWSGTVTVTGGTHTITLNGTMTAVTLSLPTSANVTIAGTGGWSVGTTNIIPSGSTYTLTLHAGATYTWTTLLSINPANIGIAYTLTSDSGSVSAIVNLSYGASQLLAFVNATRIDSSGGQTIFSYKGVLTTVKNWATGISNGNLTNPLTGAANTVSGVTYDKSGNILGSCTVYLFRDNGNSTATFVAATTSNAGTGAYSFTVYSGSTYFVVAFGVKSAVDVFDCTDRIVTAV